MIGNIVSETDFFVAPQAIIQANDDLNNFTTAGHYVCVSDVVAQTIANIPLKEAGRLIVINTIKDSREFVLQNGVRNYFLQWYVTRTGTVYVRTLSNFGATTITFGAWRRLLEQEATT